jgi:hypothetical protein
MTEAERSEAVIAAAGPVAGTFTVSNSDNDTASSTRPGTSPNTHSDISMGSNSITGDGTTDVDSNPGAVPNPGPHVAGPVAGTFTILSSETDSTSSADSGILPSIDSSIFGRVTNPAAGSGDDDSFRFAAPTYSSIDTGGDTTDVDSHPGAKRPGAGSTSVDSKSTSSDRKSTSSGDSKSMGADNH